MAFMEKVPIYSLQ